MTLRSILAVTDFSRKVAAIARAAPLCAEHRATLKLVYLAHPDEAPPPDAAVRLAQHALQLRQRHHITVQAATRMDLTAADVAREAADADLVVWGTAPLRGLAAWFRTHPAVRMLRACQRPVLVVRKAAAQPYQSLLVAVDFRRCRSAWWNWALHCSRRHASSCFTPSTRPTRASCAMPRCPNAPSAHTAKSAAVCARQMFTLADSV